MRYLLDVTEQNHKERQSRYPVFRPNSTHVLPEYSSGPLSLETIHSVADRNTLHFGRAATAKKCQKQSLKKNQTIRLLSSLYPFKKVVTGLYEPPTVTLSKTPVRQTFIYEDHSEKKLTVHIFWVLYL
jgi:hypothetical protein